MSFSEKKNHITILWQTAKLRLPHTEEKKERTRSKGNPNGDVSQLTKLFSLEKNCMRSFWRYSVKEGNEIKTDQANAGC